MGHWHFMHPLKNLFWSIINLFVMFTLFSFVINNHAILYSLGFLAESNFISLMLFFKLYEPVSFLTLLIQTLLSRHFEFQADAFAAQVPSLRVPLARALIKIHITNAANLSPDPLYAAIKFSHPQLTERLKALKYDAKEPGAEVEISITKRVEKSPIEKPVKDVADTEMY